MTHYGLIGAGAVSRSLVARFAATTAELGPVMAPSYRVASRIANSLRAGVAARHISELYHAGVLLFCSNPAGVQELIRLMESVPFDWTGRAIIVCDTEVPIWKFDGLRSQGASVCSVSQITLPGRYIVQGDPEAVKAARCMVRKLGGRVILLQGEDAPLFQAAMTMGTALLTPLLDRAAHVFRKAGLRDKQAMELASAIFERTARGFGHSGRQSWVWHLRQPDVKKLQEQASALRHHTTVDSEFLRDVQAALETLGRHKDVLEKLQARERPRSVRLQNLDYNLVE